MSGDPGPKQLLSVWDLFLTHSLRLQKTTEWFQQRYFKVLQVDFEVD